MKGRRHATPLKANTSLVLKIQRWEAEGEGKASGLEDPLATRMSRDKTGIEAGVLGFAAEAGER